MLLLIILGILFCGGLVYQMFEDWGEGGFMVSIISGILLIVCLISIPLQRIDIESNIAEYLATKETIETARQKGNNFENAALQQKIIDQNKWLASVQYYNSTIFDLWIPDQVMQLKF